MKLSFVDKDSFQVILRRVYVLFLNNTTRDFQSTRSRSSIIFLLDLGSVMHEDTSKLSKTSLTLPFPLVIKKP